MGKRLNVLVIVDSSLQQLVEAGNFSGQVKIERTISAGLHPDQLKRVPKFATQVAALLQTMNIKALSQIKDVAAENVRDRCPWITLSIPRCEGVKIKAPRNQVKAGKAHCVLHIKAATPS